VADRPGRAGRASGADHRHVPVRLHRP
jgi:hypothetical protein